MALSPYSTLAEALRSLPRRPGRGFRFVGASGADRVYEWGALYEEACRRGALLSALGLEKGDRLALVLPEPSDFVLSFLGAVTAGIVPVPIYPRATFKGADGYREVVSHIIDAAGAKMLLTDAQMAPHLEGVTSRSGALDQIVTVDRAFDGKPASHWTPPSIRETDTCFLQFTSGSTTKPKGVVVTHGNLRANSSMFLGPPGLHIREEDVAVSWLPLYHDMGLIGFVLGPIFCDLPSVLMPTASFARMPRSWLEALQKYNGTLTYAPNFAYGLVAKRVRDRDLTGLDLSRVRVFGCGAEPIRGKTWRDFQARLAPAGVRENAFLPSYGMAESTLAITFHGLDTPMRVDRVDPDELRRGNAVPSDASNALEIVSCGRAFPGHELVIAKDDGQPLGERKVGQVIVRGPSVTRGYFENPDATAACYRDGWLETGDLGYVADGDLFVCGRSKDLIIVKGANYHPQDIEWMVGDMDKVRRGNVFAFSVDRDGSEELVVIAEAHSGDAPELRRAIAERILGEFGLAAAHVGIVPVGTLPRTSSGKAQRRKTKELFERGKLPEHRPTDGAGTGSEEETP